MGVGIGNGEAEVESADPDGEAAASPQWDDEGLKGFRHGPAWTYLMVLLSSAVALFASFVLAAETLQLARHPASRLSCDINALVSCSTVAQSWQSEFVRLGTLPVPNAFFGIAAESVFVTLAVIGMTGAALPRWFNVSSWVGGLFALIFAYWLFIQSMFVIKALCPWCLTLMFATTIQFMALTHATVTVRRLPSPTGRFAPLARALRRSYRLHFDLMFDLVWLVALAALIVVVEGPALF